MVKLLESRMRRFLHEMTDGVMHYTIVGVEVPYESEECICDLRERLSDARRARDKHPRGSELRMCYNGLMKNYRLLIKRHPLHVLEIP
jgi:hypothetical protein